MILSHHRDRIPRHLVVCLLVDPVSPIRWPQGIQTTTTQRDEKMIREKRILLFFFLFCPECATHNGTDTLLAQRGISLISRKKKRIRLLKKNRKKTKWGGTENKVDETSRWNLRYRRDFWFPVRDDRPRVRYGKRPWRRLVLRSLERNPSWAWRKTMKTLVEITTRHYGVTLRSRFWPNFRNGLKLDDDNNKSLLKF